MDICFCKVRHPKVFSMDETDFRVIFKFCKMCRGTNQIDEELKKYINRHLHNHRCTLKCEMVLQIIDLYDRLKKHREERQYITLFNEIIDIAN